MAFDGGVALGGARRSVLPVAVDCDVDVVASGAAQPGAQGTAGAGAAAAAMLRACSGMGPGKGGRVLGELVLGRQLLLTSSSPTRSQRCRAARFARG